MIKKRVVCWLIGSLLLVLSSVWILTTTSYAHEKISLSRSKESLVDVQGTPTEDPTIPVLQKQETTQRIDQLQIQNDRSFGAWIWSNSATFLSPAVLILLAVGGGIRWWLGDRRIEREKRDEERFQTAVAALGSKDIEVKIGSAIMIREFLNPGHKKEFCKPALNLAIAHLRLRRTNFVPPSTMGQLLIATLKGQKVTDTDIPLPLDSFNHALITIFKDAFPLVHGSINGDHSQYLSERTLLHFNSHHTPFVSESVDATGVQLDNGYLAHAKLADIWLPKASLRKANLVAVDLRRANLEEADFRDANLTGAHLEGAVLINAKLEGANLEDAHLEGTDVKGTILDR